MIRNWLKTISDIISARPNSRPKKNAGKHPRVFLNLERLEDRETPSATITSTLTSLSILVPATETAVLNVSSGFFTVTDSAGVTGTGGTIVSNTFTANSAASGVTGFVIVSGSAGTVQLGAANLFTTTTTCFIDAGVLDLNGLSQVIGGLEGAGAVTNSKTPSTAQLTINPLSASDKFTGQIEQTVSGAVIALVVNGGEIVGNLQRATEALTGTNSYSGGTTVNGILKISADANLGAAPAAPTAADLVINSGGQLTIASSFTLSTNRGLAIGPASGSGSASIVVATPDTLTYDGIIANNGSGTGGLTISGNAVLGGGNTYTGGTTIQFGVTEFDSLAAVAGSGANVTVTSGGTAAAGFSINQSFLDRIVSSSVGAVALGVDSANNLDFSAAGADLPSVSLGAVAGSGMLTNTFTYSGTLTPFGSTYLLGGGGGALTFASSLNASGAGLTVGLNGLGGTVILTGVNLYAGGTTVDGGVLSLSSDANLGPDPSSPTPGNLTLDGGVLFANASVTINSKRGLALDNPSEGSDEVDVAAGAMLTYGGIAAGPGSLVVGSGSNTGVLTLAGINTFSGGTTVDAGVLSISSDANLGADPSVLTIANLALAGGTLLATTTATIDSNRGIALGSYFFPTPNSGEIDVAAGATLTFNGIIANNGGPVGNLIVGSGSNTGVLVLGGVNTYNGSTTINAGTLVINADANLGVAPSTPTAADLIINSGATLEIAHTLALNNNRGMAIGSPSGPGSASIAVNTGVSLFFGGIIANNGSGTGSLILTGLGVKVLSGSNSYTGATTVNAGTLSISGDANLGTAPSSATANDLVLNAGTTLLVTSSFTLSSDRGMSIGPASGSGGADIDVANSQTLTYNGVIANNGSGTGTLIIGAGGNGGTLVLGGADTYSGGTTVDAGVVEFASLAAIAGSGPNVTVNAAGTAAAGFAINQNFIDRIANSSTGVAALGADSANNLNFNAAGANLPNVSLGAVKGSGVLNPNTFTYSGTLTPFGSAYLLGGGGGTLTYTKALSGKLEVGVTGMADGAVNVGVGPGTLTITVQNGTVLELNSTTNVTPGTLVVNAGGAVEAGPSYNNGNGIDQTFLGLLSSSSTGAVVLGANSANNLNFSSSGADLPSVSLGVVEGSALTYSGILTPYGNTYMLGGGGGTLTFSSVLTGAGDGLTVGANDNSGTVILTDPNTYAGGTTVDSGVLSISSDANLGTDPSSPAAGNLTLNGGDLLANASLTINSNRGVVLGPGTGTGGGEIDAGAGATLAYSGIIANNGSGTGSLIVGSGGNTGVLTLAGANSYTGSTTLNAGTLSIGSDSNLGAAPSSETANDLVLNSGTTLMITSGFTLSDNRDIGLTGPFGSGGADISIANAQTLTYGGGITDGGNVIGLTISGAGIFSFNGTDAGTGMFTINPGITLSGSSVFDGSVQVDGTLAPGSNTTSPGTALVNIMGMLSFGPTSVFSVNIIGAKNYDCVVAAGGISLSSTAAVNVTLLNGYVPGPSAPGNIYPSFVILVGNGIVVSGGGFGQGAGAKGFTITPITDSNISNFPGVTPNDVLLPPGLPLTDGDIILTPDPKLLGPPAVNGSGTAISIVSASGNGTTATITTNGTPSGFWPGELVTLSGVTPGGPGGLAGTVTVTGLPSATTFQFASTYSGTETLSGATVAASLAGAQRSMVDSIVYNFTEPVTLTAAAFSINVVVDNTSTGNEVGVAPTLNVAPVPFTNEWVVTFTDPVNGSVIGNSIANGAYSISINPAFVTSATGGLNLSAGETDTFYRLYGDVSGVQSVKNVDANAFNRAWGNFYYSANFNAALDYNDDGKFTNIDANAFNRAFNTRYSVTTTI